MEKTIEIYDIVQSPKPTSKGETYWKVATSDGNFNIFDKDLIAEIRTGLNKKCKVEITDSGKYRNLTKFIEIVSDVLGGGKDIIANPNNSKIFSSGGFRTPTQITRTECISKAIDTLTLINERNKEIGKGAELLTPEELLGTILTLAKEYEKYIIE